MSFTVAAESYDRFMGRFSIPLAVRFAEWVLPLEASDALDVGCGPGALTTVLVDRLGADHVSAVDPSEQFVRAALSRLPGVDVRSATAEDLPFPDNAFDVALAALVVHFMTDPLAGVREMMRVTRPGGVVAACVWDLAGSRAPQSLFFLAMREATGTGQDEMDRVGAGAGQIEDLLRTAGCSSVSGTELTVVVPHASFEEWWDPFTLGVGPPGQQLSALDERDRTRVRDAARAMVPATSFSSEVTAWAAQGTVPG